MLLEAPILPTLLRLAAPNVLVMLAQAAAGLIETYFIGQLGTDALAGMALVFPVVMLMQMTSAGAMGGGIASAIARALGAGDARMPMRWSACDRHRAGLRPAFTLACWAVGAGSSRNGRQRRRAGGGARLFELGLRRCGAGVAVQFARRRDPRHRQHGVTGHGDLCGRMAGAAVGRC